MLVNGSKDRSYSVTRAVGERDFSIELSSSPLCRGDWAVSREKEGVGRGRKQG